MRATLIILLLAAPCHADWLPESRQAHQETMRLLRQRTRLFEQIRANLESLERTLEGQLRTRLDKRRLSPVPSGSSLHRESRTSNRTKQ